MNARVCEKTIAYGRNQYRVTSDGKWSTLMWGWFGPDQGRPIYCFEPIPTDRVPKEVRRFAQ